MLFNSFAYILVFLPVVLVVHAAARRAGGARAAQVSLLLASLAFYGWAKPAQLPLLAGSILVNWGLARAMRLVPEGPRRKRILQLGLLLNIGFLCTFKYANFFLGGLARLGLPHIALPDWSFPLGISFFTLTQVMYLVDCYETLVAPSHLADHATFVSFFPYVTSGPLARAKRMVRQLAGDGTASLPATEQAKAGDPDRWELAARGVFLFAVGLFKKAILADSFARVADVGYASAGAWSTVEAWAFSVAYTLQIYFDFSGYTDMAVGSAHVLGVDIPRNFNAPLRSRSIIEFWQRWHMSLSAFITTYLYTPILQSFRRATLATAAVATMLAMTIAGLWHGPSWTFIVFGALHGAALVVNQVWKKKVKRKLPTPIAIGLTFAFVNLAFVFFRSPDLATAGRIVARLVPGAGALGTAVLTQVRTVGVTTLVPPLLVGAVIAFVGKSSDQLAAGFRLRTASSLGTAGLLLVSFLYMNSNIVKSFVYFAF